MQLRTVELRIADSRIADCGLRIFCWTLRSDCGLSAGPCGCTPKPCEGGLRTQEDSTDRNARDRNVKVPSQMNSG